MIRSTTPAKISSVVCQSTAELSATASGENRNWPNELAAVPTPNENARHCGGSNLPNAPITTVNDTPASPKPTIKPPERYISVGDDANVIHENPTV